MVQIFQIDKFMQLNSTKITNRTNINIANISNRICSEKRTCLNLVILTKAISLKRENCRMKKMRSIELIFVASTAGIKPTTTTSNSDRLRHVFVIKQMPHLKVSKSKLKGYCDSVCKNLTSQN